MRRHFAPILALALIGSGCASGPPFIDEMQPEAMAKAVRRAQFEFNCPAASGEIINRQTLQPLMFGGPIRAQYTIGVSGCEQRATVDVLCSDNNKQCVEGKLSR